MAETALYDQIGTGYSLGRRTDPRWMTAILDALGTANVVANVGAGTGSYEPGDRSVIPLEPSTEMIRQRPHDARPAVRAVAEALPLRDHAVDVALAVLTVHHWTDWRAGLAELRRIAPRQVVLAYDTQRHTEFWLVREYIPEIADVELTRPSADDIANDRRSCSALAQADPGAVERGIRRLSDDLHSGRWHARHQDLLDLDQWDVGFRLVVSHS